MAQTLKEKLSNIQVELKAPKNQRNNFGNYNYRSCEDILEGVKPLCNKNRCTLTIQDSIEVYGTRTYVKATATLIDWDSDMTIVTSALAREEESKKGMDSSQVTGATSSYARKYALNGLFNIDDTKDTDTEAYQSYSKQSKPKSTKKVAEKPVDPLVEEIGQFYSTHKGFGQAIKSVLQQEGVNSVGELPQEVLQHLVELARKSANSFQ